ncbi:MAG TPA: hypothetical protein VKL21_00800 [Candidatus Methanoperedens sp.]|nr:hypothetical protein [Candidatus Methanoperedens sp.]
MDGEKEWPGELINMILNLFGIEMKIFENSEEQKREKNRKEVIDSWKFWKQGGI